LRGGGFFVFDRHHPQRAADDGIVFQAIASPHVVPALSRNPDSLANSVLGSFNSDIAGPAKDMGQDISSITQQAVSGYSSCTATHIPIFYFMLIAISPRSLSLKVSK
jgi:hypothetical protein